MDISVGITSSSNMENDPDKDELMEFLDYDIREKVKTYFEDKSYGQGVLAISSGFILYDPIDLRYVKPIKPRFRKHFEIKSIMIGVEDKVYKNLFSIEVWVEYAQVKALATLSQKVEYILNRVGEDLCSLLRKRKFKDFDLDAFEADFNKMIVQVSSSVDH